MSKFVDDFRRGVYESDKIRDAGLKTPDDIERFDNIIYGNHKMQLLDVYRPIKEKGNKLPVIVNVHGGGWIYGNKDCYQYYCMDIAQRGFAVVNFSYRLAPEYKFPASLMDTCKVFEWVHDNKDEYGFDTDNVFALGDSAGGHILSLFSCMCINSELSDYLDFRTTKNLLPKAIALNCGVYNPFLVNENDGQTEILLTEVMNDKSSEKEVYFMNVLNHIKEGFPPAFIMTCNGDFLKKQALVLAEKLIEINSQFDLKFYSPVETELVHVFNCDIRNKYAQECTEEECRFFKKFRQLLKFE